eukprot:PhM_4_TR8912/c0_g1_i1/m.6122
MVFSKESHLLLLLAGKLVHGQRGRELRRSAVVVCLARRQKRLDEAGAHKVGLGHRLPALAQRGRAGRERRLELVVAGREAVEHLHGALDEVAEVAVLEGLRVALVGLELERRRAHELLEDTPAVLILDAQCVQRARARGGQKLCACQHVVQTDTAAELQTEQLEALLRARRRQAHLAGVNDGREQALRLLGVARDEVAELVEDGEVLVHDGDDVLGVRVGVRQLLRGVQLELHADEDVVQHALDDNVHDEGGQHDSLLCGQALLARLGSAGVLREVVLEAADAAAEDVGVDLPGHLLKVAELGDEVREAAAVAGAVVEHGEEHVEEDLAETRHEVGDLLLRERTELAEVARVGDGEVLAVLLEVAQLLGAERGHGLDRRRVALEDLLERGAAVRGGEHADEEVHDGALLEQDLRLAVVRQNHQPRPHHQGRGARREVHDERHELGEVAGVRGHERAHLLHVLEHFPKVGDGLGDRQRRHGREGRQGAHPPRGDVVEHAGDVGGGRGDDVRGDGVEGGQSSGEVRLGALGELRDTGVEHGRDVEQLSAVLKKRRDLRPTLLLGISAGGLEAREHVFDAVVGAELQVEGVRRELVLLPHLGAHDGLERVRDELEHAAEVRVQDRGLLLDALEVVQVHAREERLREGAALQPLVLELHQTLHDALNVVGGELGDLILGGDLLALDEIVECLHLRELAVEVGAGVQHLHGGDDVLEANLRGVDDAAGLHRLDGVLELGEPVLPNGGRRLTFFRRVVCGSRSGGSRSGGGGGTLLFLCGGLFAFVRHFLYVFSIAVVFVVF